MGEMLSASTCDVNIPDKPHCAPTPPRNLEVIGNNFRIPRPVTFPTARLPTRLPTLPFFTAFTSPRSLANAYRNPLSAMFTSQAYSRWRIAPTPLGVPLPSKHCRSQHDESHEYREVPDAEQPVCVEVT